MWIEIGYRSKNKLLYNIIKLNDWTDEKAGNSEPLTQQQISLRRKIKTGEIIRQLKKVQSFKNESLNISRISELINGAGNDLKHRLISTKEVYDAYRMAVDETAGVSSTAQPEVFV